jgi:hypothetical protein
MIRLALIVGALALTGLGAWLWTQTGVAVWLENAISYCLG